MTATYIDHHHKLHDISQPIGIYFGILVSQKSLQSIYQWCLEYGIDMTNNASPYESRIHATIFCAKQHHGKSPNDFQEHVDPTKNFIATPLSWVLIKGHNTNQSCLALKISCNDLEEYHQQLQKKTSLIHAFDKYEPHVSIHYNYNGEMPTEIPQIAIELNEMYHKPYFYNENIVNKNTNGLIESNNYQKKQKIKF